MAKDIGKNKSEIAVARVLAGERTKDVAKDLDITPQSIYCALNNRDIEIKKARDTVEQKTQRITAHLAQHILQTIEAGIDTDNGGRSARVNGVIERFEVMYQDNVERVRALLSDSDLHTLLDAHMSAGKVGSWVQGWASTVIEITSESQNIGMNDALEKVSPLVRQVLSLSESEASVLEEYLAREMRAITRHQQPELLTIHTK